MKNYKIDLFDEKELKKEYEKYDKEKIESISIDNKNIFYHNWFLSKNNTKEITKSIDYFSDFLWNDDNEIITECWEIFSESMFFSEVSYKGKNWVKKYIIPSHKYKDYKKLLLKDKLNYHNSFEEENEKCTKIVDEMFEIYLYSEAERLYNFLEDKWFDILWFNISEIGCEWYHEIWFIVKIKNKVKLKKDIIEILEKEVLEKEKRYSIGRLKEIMMDKIKLLDEKYWRNWRSIELVNKKKSEIFEEILLLLEFEFKIDIISILSWKYIIDIKLDKDFFVEDYFFKNNKLIINDGEYEIRFSGLQAILMKALCNWKIKLSDYKENWNPEETLKKISREKLKRLKNFKIRRIKIGDNFNPDKEAYIKIN